MKIGILREIKQGEARVAMTPEGVRTLLASDPRHTVYVQAGAGEMAGYTDEAYNNAGADIVPTAEEVFRKSALIVHVKEPQREEFLLSEKTISSSPSSTLRQSLKSLQCSWKRDAPPSPMRRWKI